MESLVLYFSYVMNLIISRYEHQFLRTTIARSGLY